MPKKKPMTGKPVVNKELDGFEIEINEFGEIKSNLPVDKLNRFLDRHVDDKKLDDQDLISKEELENSAAEEEQEENKNPFEEDLDEDKA
jgi:hypothetical protein